MHSWFSLLGLTGLLVLSGEVRADDPWPLFDKAVHSELHGGAAAARAAFDLYERAAAAGLPEAEFNVAVMLDSGRGVPRDVAKAATFYARAASHGHERAAYNLGQLCQTGDGVPVNADLARAWFSLSNLPAARSRSATIVSVPSADAMRHAPTPVSPAAGFRQVTETGGVELVWTSEQLSEPPLFLVEIRTTGGHDVFSGVTRVSSMFAVLPDRHGDFVWRVTAIELRASQYVASGWVRFSFDSDPKVSSQ